MEITVQIDKKKLRQVERLLAGVKGGIGKAMAGSVNDTARTTVTRMSTAIRAKVNIKKRDIDRHIRRSRATPAKPSAKISVSESTRLPLKYFGARQTRRGVTYKIDKGGGRKRIASAFGPNIPRLGGQVFRRAGKDRLPIIKLFGVSPFGVVAKSDIPQKTEAEAAALLERNLDRRTRLLLLKASGKI